MVLFLLNFSLNKNVDLHNLKYEPHYDHLFFAVYAAQAALKASQAVSPASGPPTTAGQSPGSGLEESVVYYTDSSMEEKKKPDRVVFPTESPVTTNKGTTTENEVSVVYYVDPTTDATGESKDDTEDEVSVVYYT